MHNGPMSFEELVQNLVTYRQTEGSTSVRFVFAKMCERALALFF